MNRRQKVIVSVVGIFIVLLALVGITYGYFLTRIQGNTNTTSITVTTAKLELVYGDGNGEIIEGTGALIPTTGTETKDAIGTKTFTVTNNGNDTSYEVIIDKAVTKYANNGSYKKEDGTLVTYTKDQETEFISNDFRYTLTCRVKDKNGNVLNDEKCNEVEGLDIFPYKGGILVENDILENRVHEYAFTLWYIDSGKDQSEDMNKTYQARINIDAEAEDSFSILYSFGVIGDTHISYPGAEKSFQRSLIYLKDKVDFTVVNGDFVSSATEEQLTTYKSVVDNYAGDMPVYEVIGNHESYKVDGGTSMYDKAPVELIQQYTNDPLYYSFNRGNDVFIMVGNYHEYADKAFSTEEIEWLQKTLKKNINKRCFVFQHNPEEGIAGDPGKDFVKLIKEHKNVTWVHAHTHDSFQEGSPISLKDGLGYNSVHVPSVWRNQEGYIVDVYRNKVVFKGINFATGEPYEEYIYEISNDLEIIDGFGELIPAGCTYTTASDGVVYSAGEYMPPISMSGDEFDDGEYVYKFEYRRAYSSAWTNDGIISNSWGAYAKDKTKEYYQPLQAYINNYEVTMINHCYLNATNLKAAPILPDTIRDMSTAFYGCKSLETIENIPDNVTSMVEAFMHCPSLTGTITINSEFSAAYRYLNCFNGTTKPIILNGSSGQLAEIAATANNGNVTVQ